MTTFEIGRQAEKMAVDYLLKKGHKILAQNWRNRYCEIDIISKENKLICFTEVKYRQNKKFGSGLDYITPKKLKQMEFAANMWVQDNDWQGEYQLYGIEVTGIDFEITEFIEIV